MKPDQEHIARELAYVVLAGSDGHQPAPIPGRAEVLVEMRGMVQSIRRHILIDHANVALRIADEIERQASAVDIDAMIREAVTREARYIGERIDDIVRRAIESEVTTRITRAAEVAAESIASTAASKIIQAARTP
jgi:hypothetical protein